MALETEDYGVVRLGPLAAPSGGGNVFGAPQPPNDTVPLGFYWLVTAISTWISGDIPETSNVLLYVFDQDPTLTEGAIPISKTIDGKLDVNDTCRLIIPGGQSVFFEWFDVPEGCQCYARFQYEVVTRTGAAAVRPVMH